jgi:uncharacterized membrane protein
MDFLNPYVGALHALAAIIWVGGMFFAYVILRPALVAFEPPERLKVWAGVFPKLFAWAWASAIALLLSGLWLIFWVIGGLKGMPPYVKPMMGLGMLMIFILFYIFSGPYEEFKKAVAKDDWPQAGRHLNKIRRYVLINLIIGLITSAIGASGRLWG